LIYVLTPPTIESSVPLQLTDLATVTAAYALWSQKHWAFALTYYWGLVLSTQALMSPALQSPDFPHYQFLAFWAIHLLVVWAAIYLTWGRGMRPDWRSYRLAVVVTIITVVISADKVGTPKIDDVLGTIIGRTFSGNADQTLRSNAAIDTTSGLGAQDPYTGISYRLVGNADCISAPTPTPTPTPTATPTPTPTPTCSPLLGLLSVLCPSPTPTPTPAPTPPLTPTPSPSPSGFGKALPVTGDNTTGWISVAIVLVSGGLLVELAHPRWRFRPAVYVESR